jgi:hypothetical protein
VDERPGDAAWDDALRNPDGIVAPSGASLASRLDAWLADARVEGSADARARERWLRSAAAADASLAGVLLDLAERRITVAVTVSGGRRHRGRIGVIGGDFVSLCTETGAEVLVARGAITAVRTAPHVDEALGERTVTTELRLADVLAELGTDRTRVLLVPSDGADAVAGELRAVGQDVVTVRIGGDRLRAARGDCGGDARVAQRFGLVSG